MAEPKKPPPKTPTKAPVKKAPPKAIAGAPVKAKVTPAPGGARVAGGQFASKTAPLPPRKAESRVVGGRFDENRGKQVIVRTHYGPWTYGALPPVYPALRPGARLDPSQVEDLRGNLAFRAAVDKWGPFVFPNMLDYGWVIPKSREEKSDRVKNFGKKKSKGGGAGGGF